MTRFASLLSKSLLHALGQKWLTGSSRARLLFPLSYSPVHCTNLSTALRVSRLFVETLYWYQCTKSRFICMDSFLFSPSPEEVEMREWRRTFVTFVLGHLVSSTVLTLYVICLANFTHTHTYTWETIVVSLTPAKISIIFLPGTWVKRNEKLKLEIERDSTG